MSSVIGSEDLLKAVPLFVLFLLSLLLVTIKTVKGARREPPINLTLTITICGILIAMSLLNMNWVMMGQSVSPFFMKAMVFDGMSWAVSLTVMLAGASTIIISAENPSTKHHLFTEYIFLILNAIVGMMILIWSNELLLTFIAIELMSLSLYLAIALSLEQVLSKEAAFKYFILGSLASAIILFGLSFVYGTTGTTYLDELMKSAPEMISTNRLYAVGVVLIIIGFCFKVSLFPMHFWTPDVYQGAPTPVTAFMSTAVKAASFIAFLRVYMALGFANSSLMVDIMQWFTVITILIGNIAAIRQVNLKRMLAYSSVAHSGYAFIGVLACGGAIKEGLGAASLVFYLVSYYFMTFGAFLLISILEKYENTSIHLSDLHGVAKKYPAIALGLVVLLLSLAGIPPMLGFWAKLYIFSAAIEQGLYWLAIWGVIGSVIGVYYYLRPIVCMYMHEGPANFELNGRSLSKGVFALSVFVVVALGFFSNPIFAVVKNSVRSLF